MTTVGYGDLYPNTQQGRILTFFIFLCGLFLISLTFGTVVDITKLSLAEQNVLVLIKNLRYNKRKVQVSAKIITKIMKINMMKNKFKRKHKLHKVINYSFAINYELSKLRILQNRFYKLKQKVKDNNNDIDFKLQLVNGIKQIQCSQKSIELYLNKTLKKIITLEEKILM